MADGDKFVEGDPTDCGNTELKPTEGQRCEDKLDVEGNLVLDSGLVEAGCEGCFGIH